MIARVFPTRTNMSPDDEYAFFGMPPMFRPKDITEVHISVCFTWDIQKARDLAEAWLCVAPVRIGGPAFGFRSGAFVPGMYMKKGIVITSRGCPNSCWFCTVSKREGGLRELPVQDGYIIQDDNLLACGKEHVLSVFGMLRSHGRGSGYPPAQLMGLEAGLFKPWHVQELLSIRFSALWFAYDAEEDRRSLAYAGRLLDKTKISRVKRYCYMLCGYPGDTFKKALGRAQYIWDRGFIPFAQKYRDVAGLYDKRWKSFAKTFSRPASAYSVLTGKTTWDQK